MLSTISVFLNMMKVGSLGGFVISYESLDLVWGVSHLRGDSVLLCNYPLLFSVDLGKRDLIWSR